MTMHLAQYHLSQYLWKNRVLLVFTVSAEDARFTEQLALFDAQAPALAERDIVVLKIVGAKETRLRNQFRVDTADFAVILVGKDGNEKHRWTRVAPVEQINHRIDRMPMRRSEMRGSPPV